MQFLPEMASILHSLSALSVLFEDVDYKTLFEREASACSAVLTTAAIPGLDAYSSQSQWQLYGA